MEFMSVEHVAAMNAVLLDAPAVRALCATLDRPLVMSYRLTDGPGGGIVHWTVTFGQTVQFSLDEAPAPDVCLVGDWRQVVREAAEARKGRRSEAEVSIEGDESALAEIHTVLETARTVATMPVDFPSE